MRNKFVSITVIKEVDDFLKERAKPFESRGDVLLRLLKLPPRKEERGRPPKEKANGEV